MNWDQITGDWEHFRIKVKEKWAHITDDDMTTVEGKREKFLDLLQVRCKLSKADAEKELNDLLRTMTPATKSVPKLAGMPGNPPEPKKSP
jgi:uncharacterized protein YjbJ (UPF0337 family)